MSKEALIDYKKEKIRAAVREEIKTIADNLPDEVLDKLAEMKVGQKLEIRVTKGGKK